MAWSLARAALFCGLVLAREPPQPCFRDGWPCLNPAVPWEPTSECRKRPKDAKKETFLVMVGAHEQENKNIAMVAEAASWARELKRTFVEPVMCNSRIVSPFDSREEAGEKLFEEFGSAQAVTEPKTCRPGDGKLALSAEWDIDRMCKQVPTLSYPAFKALIADTPAARKAGGGPGLRDDAAFHKSEDFAHDGKEISAGKENPKPKQAKARVLYVSNWYRSLPSRVVTRQGGCTAHTCFDGMQFLRAHRLQAFVRETARLAGRYTCVQWRSETKASLKTVEKCAAALVRGVAKAHAAEGVRDAPVLLVSDLYGGASNTYKGFRSSPEAQRALKTLQRDLLGATWNESDVKTGPLSPTGKRAPSTAKPARATPPSS